MEAHRGRPFARCYSRPLAAPVSSFEIGQLSQRRALGIAFNVRVMAADDFAVMANDVHCHSLGNTRVLEHLVAVWRSEWNEILLTVRRIEGQQRSGERNRHAPPGLGGHKPQLFVFGVDVVTRQPGDVLEALAGIKPKKDDSFPFTGGMDHDRFELLYRERAALHDVLRKGSFHHACPRVTHL
jgi:hypothetical protein